jgi:hypothetical protein
MTNWAIKALACSLFVLSAGVVVTTASEPGPEAHAFLEFEANSDGKCQNLSRGGELGVMRNRHPTLKIKFRLMRYFAEVRQSGRATGIAPPGGDLIKLGCTKIGGREQRWVVEHAEFLVDASQ